MIRLGTDLRRAVGLAVRRAAVCAGFFAVVSTWAAPPVVHVSREAVAAFDALVVVDQRIAKLIELGETLEVAAEARLVKVHIETLRDAIQTDDGSVAKRIRSAARESLALAERLGSVAARGNLRRTETVYRNLHRYVEFVAQHLPATLEPEDRS